MAKLQKSTKKVILSDDEDNHKETYIKFQMTHTGDISKLVQNQLMQTKSTTKVNPSKTKELWQPKEQANSKKIQIDPMDQRLLRQRDKISRLIMENAQQRARAEHSPEKAGSGDEGKRQSVQASMQTSSQFQSTKSPLKAGASGKKGKKCFYDPYKMYSIKDFSYAGTDEALDYEQNKDHIVSFQHYIRRLMTELNSSKPYSVRDTMSDHFQVLDKQKEREKGLKTILEQNKYVDAKNPALKAPQKRIPVKLTLVNEDGTTQVISHMLNPDRLQEQLVRKYSHVLSSGKYPEEKVIRKMAKDYNNMLNSVKKGGFKVSVPKKYKPQLQDYNDYYTLKGPEDMDDSEVENEYQAMNEIIGNQIEEELNPDDDVLSVMRTSSSEDEGGQVQKVGKKASVKFREDELDKYNEQNAGRGNKSADDSPQGHPNNNKGRDDQDDGNEREDNLHELRRSKSRKDEENEKLDTEEKGMGTVETLEGENLDHYVQAYENAKPQLPNIIDQLLEAPSILDAKIDFRKNIGEIPKIPEDLLFENEEDRKIYEVIFRWQYQLEKELKEEEKNLKRADSEESSDESSGND